MASTVTEQENRDDFVGNSMQPISQVTGQTANADGQSPQSSEYTIYDYTSS